MKKKQKIKKIKQYEPFGTFNDFEKDLDSDKYKRLKPYNPHAPIHKTAVASHINYNKMDNIEILPIEMDYKWNVGNKEEGFFFTTSFMTLKCPTLDELDNKREKDD
jgi:hypothetical protein